MLLQSSFTVEPKNSQSSINLLPALPKQWADGEVSGLRARGGFEVSIRWRGGQVEEATITKVCGSASNVSVGYNGKQKTFSVKQGETIIIR